MNSFRTIVYILIFTSLFSVSKAQSPPLKGRVIDSQTQQALVGARIDVPFLGTSFQTDQQGYFEVSGIAAANHLEVSMLGYKNQRVELLANQSDYTIQMEADLIYLNEVRVNASDGSKTARETPGAVSVLTTREIARGNSMSLQPALNSIAGVRMDQSTLSEARISIRGNGVRSAYGIRNIKLYVNEIPLTEADGTTRIEALDVNSIGRAEVIKGPASSIYGAGMGGGDQFSIATRSLPRKKRGSFGIDGCQWFTSPSHNGSKWRGSDQFLCILWLARICRIPPA